MFFVDAVTLGSIRYRYPVMLFFMIFAAYAGVDLWKKMKPAPAEESIAYA